MFTRQLITLEKAMLAYASYGDIRDVQNNYPYFLKKYNCVHIRETLVKAGLLKLGTYFQSIPYYPYKKLQSLLKQMNYPCGNSKAKVIKNAESYLTESDLEEFFGYRCYFPTPLSVGKYETSIDYYHVDLQLDKLQLLDKDCYNYYVLKDTFKEVHIKSINSKNSYIITEAEDILSLHTYNDCSMQSQIKLFYDDIYIHYIDNVNEVYFFDEEQQVFFVTNIENKKYYCKRFDIKTKKFLPELQFAHSPWNYLLNHELDTLDKLDNSKIISENEQELYEEEQLIKKMLEKQTGIFDADGSIIYYFSVSNPIIQIVVENYFGNIADVSVMTPLFEEDFSTKYLIKIPKDNKELERLLLWLFKDKQITPPQISGIPVSCICNGIKGVYAKKKYTNYAHVKNKLNLEGKSTINIISELNKVFPVKILTEDDYYISYRGVSCYDNRQDFFHVYECSNEYATKYQHIYLNLEEKGIIPTKWKSEFELYMLVKSYFEDAIYQYHDDWLGLQSLDIFIPQKIVGIEYQGIQHYEAVERFGGEEGYITTQKRDEVKKQKCQQEGVILLYWNYKVKINDTNLKKLFNSISINLPTKKANVTYMPYKDTTKKKTANKFYIACYTLKGNFECVFSNITEAANAKGVSTSSISKVLRGERNTSANCVWRKYNENEKIPDNIDINFDIEKINTGTAYAVCQYTLNGELVKIYKTASEAEKCTGISRKQILETINNRQNTAGGYIWKRKS